MGFFLLRPSFILPTNQRLSSSGMRKDSRSSCFHLRRHESFSVFSVSCIFYDELQTRSMGERLNLNHAVNICNKLSSSKMVFMPILAGILARVSLMKHADLFCNFPRMPPRGRSSSASVFIRGCVSTAAGGAQTSFNTGGKQFSA